MKRENAVASETWQRPSGLARFPATAKPIVAFLCCWTLFVSLIVGFIGYAAISQVRAANWSSTTGTVLESRVEYHQGSRSTTSAPFIRYEFFVGGSRRESAQYRKFRWSTSEHSENQRIVRSFPVGRQVVVWYDAADPGDSVLTVGLDSQDFTLFTFMLPFLGPVVFGWPAVALLAGERLNNKNVAGRRVLGEHHAIVLRTSSLPHSVLPAGLLFTLCAFIGAFVSLVSGQPDSRAERLALILALSVSVSLAAMIVTLIAKRRALPDLSLTGDTLTFRAAYPYRGSRSIAVTAVRDIVLLPSKFTEARPPGFDLAVAIDGNGSMPERIMFSLTEADALEIESWLRWRLGLDGSTRA